MIVKAKTLTGKLPLPLLFLRLYDDTLSSVLLLNSLEDTKLTIF